MNKPLISVVMPVRNMGRFLEQSIQSILAQTFSDFELLIVDFGSSDESMATGSKYALLDRRIKMHEIAPCSLAEARNAGCSLSLGKYIGVQDADDISLPDRLRAEVEFMEDDPRVGLVGGMAEWVDVEGRSLFISCLPTDEEEIKKALEIDSAFCHTSLLIRKGAFDLVGGYRPVMTCSHDYDLVLRISERYRCANLDQVLVKYRIHSNQISLSKRRMQTLCKLAAQASAALRRAGRTDPLDFVGDITSASLAGMGLTERQQELAVFADYRDWIDSLTLRGEIATALNITSDALQLPWKYVDSSRVAELHFSAARLSWKERKFAKCFVALCRAIWLRPAAAEHIVESLTWRIRVSQFWRRLCGHQH